MRSINFYLSKLFSSLGKFVAHHRKKCVIFPVLLTAFLSYGITYYTYTDDYQYLYSVTGSENKKAGEVVDKYFPENPSYYDPSRTSNIGRFLRIIVTEKNEGNIFLPEIWEELDKLDAAISDVEVDSRNLSSLCAKWRNECSNLNSYLEMKDIIPEIANGSLKLSYPTMFNLKTLNSYNLPTFLAGIKLKADMHSIQSAKAITLNYNLKVGNEKLEEDDSRGKEWEAAVIKRLEILDPEWKHIKVYRFSMVSFSYDGLESLLLSLPAFIVTGILAALFAIVTSMQSDCVRSKAMLGLFGLISALLGIIASFGVLCYSGVPIVMLECIVPFLLLGIGMDDTFVLIAAWRQTNCRDSVAKRLSDCYSHAAVSITITSLTDMFSFFVGIFTPIPIIQLFSICAGTGVAFIYFWHLFFFGGLLAIYGRNEELNRHSIFWWIQAVPKSKAETVSGWRRRFLIGGYDESDPGNPMNYSENSLMAFFRDGFSTTICSKCGQVVVIATYVVYILFSIWGLSNLEEGVEIDRLVRYDSDIGKFMGKSKQYFSTYGYRIQIVIGTPLDYSKNETQLRVNKMLEEVYGLNHFTYEYSENWLRDYARYLNVYQDLLEVNVTNEKEFNQVYLEQYAHDGMPSHLDVKFNEDNSTIIASRFIVQSTDVGGANALKDLVLDLRNTLKKYPDLNATAFMPWLDFVDQAIIIRELAINLVIIAAIVVMAVTVLFLPNIVTSVAVCFSIASIELGVLGFLSFVDVHLDIVSLITIVACIGFSVDFSAHISFSYISSSTSDSKERIRESLYSLGLPITQGAVTTIIEVLGLLYVSSYSFQAGFKIYFLVMIFATFHGLFILPVLLLLLRPENIKNSWKSKTYSVNHGKFV